MESQECRNPRPKSACVACFSTEAVQCGQFLKNHYINLLSAAAGLNDTQLIAESRQGLAELAASDPRSAELDQRLAAVRAGERAINADELLTLAYRARDTSRFDLAARASWGTAIARRVTSAHLVAQDMVDQVAGRYLVAPRVACDPCEVE